MDPEVSVVPRASAKSSARFAEEFAGDEDRHAEHRHREDVIAALAAFQT
jgi:hypothetical protein